MNVVNIAAVAEFCEALAARTVSPVVATWIRRNVRKHVLRTPDFHVAVDASSVRDLVARGELDEEPGWLRDAVARGDVILAFEPSGDTAQTFAREVASVVDHREAVFTQDMSKVAVPDAVEAAHAWERARVAAAVAEFARVNGVTPRHAGAILAGDDPTVAALWPDSEATREVLRVGERRFVEVTDARGLEREGALLGHCVGSYAARVASGRTRIFSVRGSGNMPEATVEVGPLGRTVSEENRILAMFVDREVSVAVQVRGAFNRAPPKDTVDAVTEAFRRTGIMVSSSERRWLGLPDDLDPYGRVDVPAMARALPSVAMAEPDDPKVRPRRGILRACEVMLSCPDVDAGTRKEALRVIAPDRSALKVGRVTLVDDLDLHETTWTVPNMLLASSHHVVVREGGQDLADGLREVGLAVVEGVEAAPGDVHKVVPVVGTWPSEVPFFAWCGLMERWGAAVARSVRVRHDRLVAERARTKEALRTERDEGRRARLTNLVAVQIPRHLPVPPPVASRPSSSAIRANAVR